MSASNRVLIGGGTGFVGSHLTNYLKRKKYDVTIISRLPGPGRMTWHDLSNNGLPSDTKAIINTAGQNILDMSKRWTDSFKQAIWNSRVHTTKQIVNAIVKSKIKPEVFVSMSGVGAYQPNTDILYDENSPCKECDYLSKLAKHWESAAEIPQDIDTRVAIIRSGVVLGKNGGMIKQLYLPFKFGLGGKIGSGNQYLPWIHIDDLVRLIIYSIENSKVKGILNGVAPQIITNEEFTKEFAKALNRPALFPVPATILEILLSKERSKIMTEGQKVVPKRVLELGFNYKYSNIQDACIELAN